MICDRCGYSHSLERRLASMRRMLPASIDELREAHPCWWSGSGHTAGNRRLYRDLHRVGAIQMYWGGWAIPAERKAA